MAASQRDVRAFEDEQARNAGLPQSIDDAGAAFGSAPSTLGSGQASGSSTIPLGPKLPQIVTSSPAMDKAVGGILAGQQALNERLGPLQGAVEERRSSLQGELDKPMPSATKLNAIPQFQPRELSGQELTLFGGIAMAIAGLGTKAMRGDITTALNAAGSAMKGFNEGNLQQSRLDLENFKRSMDSVIAENHRMSDEYRTILENRKLSLMQKEQALRVAASSRDDQVMLSALSQGQFRTVFDLEAHRINATNQASLQATQIYETARYRQQQLERQNEPLVPVQRPDGSTVYLPRSQASGMVVPPRNSGDRLSEAEAKGTLFWRQMSGAEEAAKAVAGAGFDPASLGSQVDVRMANSDMTNWLAPENAQRYAQASEQWAEAYLRLKTGAATTADEIKRNARAYFPQPGDNPGTIAQKNAARAQAIQDVSIIAGRGVDRAPGGATPPTAGGGPRKIRNDAEYNALPSGAEFIGPDGQRRRKP